MLDRLLTSLNAFVAGLEKEPSLVIGFGVFIVATVALIVAGTDTEQALITALGISGIQAIVTRSKVSPAKRARRRRR